MWQIMYRLCASDPCKNFKHSCCNVTGISDKDTVFRALSVYKAMTAEHIAYSSRGTTARDCSDSAKCNHDMSPEEIAAMFSRVHATKKRSTLNSAFYASFHALIQGLCMHYITNKDSLNEEDTIKIMDAALQWYAEEWSIYRCNGCSVKEMGKDCYDDIVNQHFDGESHLCAGGCSTPEWIESVLAEIFDSEEVDGNGDEGEVSHATVITMERVIKRIKDFEGL